MEQLKTYTAGGQIKKLRSENTWNIKSVLKKDIVSSIKCSTKVQKDEKQKEESPNWQKIKGC